MPYRLVFLSSAQREFLSLSSELQRRIDKRLIALENVPRPAGVKSLKAQDNLWRIRVGDFRVIYQVDDRTKVITVIRIRPRATVYRWL